MSPALHVRRRSDVTSNIITVALRITRFKIDRLEWMHSRGVLHRDIQLGNICLGREPNDQTFYMIDFGFSKLYIDPKTKRHVPDTPPVCFIGKLLVQYGGFDVIDASQIQAITGSAAQTFTVEARVSRILSPLHPLTGTDCFMSDA